MILSNVISKEKLSAYQRWEMASFEDENNPHSVKSTSSDREDVKQLKITAQKEGFTKGFEEGYQVGLKTGQQEGLQPLQQELATLQQISTQFSASLQQAEHLIAQQVLDLALELTKAMLKCALTFNPELIIPIVEQAIASLPSVQQPAQLFLHPKDGSLVKDKIGEALTSAGWVIVYDPHLQPGDCRIETSKNQINGSLASRWEQLTNALGHDNSWYAVAEHESN